MVHPDYPKSAASNPRCRRKSYVTKADYRNDALVKSQVVSETLQFCFQLSDPAPPVLDDSFKSKPHMFKLQKERCSDLILGEMSLAEIMKHVMCVMGTRPEIIKMQPVIAALLKKRRIKVTIVHSGQHYDKDMSRRFLEELRYPKPDVNLGIGSGTHARQTGAMMIGYENTFRRLRPDIVLAEGDTNTVVAAGMTAIKLKIPFGHVESGLRCFDRRMPEEINRTIADDCAEMCFAPTEISAANLMREGISPERIFITGNTVVEACQRNLAVARERSSILDELGISGKTKLILVTAHREENVDNPSRLRGICRALASLDEFRIIYPIHPRTARMLRRFNLDKTLRRRHIITTNPLGYWDFLKLLAASDIVLTDSGGVQEEALTVGVPCLTMRYSTERPETVRVGANLLVGTEPSIITKLVRRLSNDTEIRTKLRRIKNPLGDGTAGKTIANLATRSGSFGRPKTYMKDGAPTFRLLLATRDRKVNSLLSKHPNTSITIAYDSDGDPVLPSPNLKIGAGWHIQVFGEESELLRFVDA